MEPLVIEGLGLHSGARSRVTFTRRPGALTFNGRELDALAVVDTTRATSVGPPRVGTVEHLFAALAALGVRAGVAIDVEGPELPLLDGGALVWIRAIAPLDLPRRSPSLYVAAGAIIDVGDSRYTFAPGAALRVEVAAVFDDARIEPRASWSGDADDFCERIAPARTFAFAHEVGALAARGLASHVAPESVVVIDGDRVHAAGRAFDWGEPARHKLLDLVGDLFLYGGPPIGAVHARRPGHAATHEAIRRALAQGVLVARGGSGPLGQSG